jgi:ubiquitin-associated SH3 domain-containing protein
MFAGGNITSEESDYYHSNHGRNDATLRFIIIRHAERVDLTYGRGWTQKTFNYAGQYYPTDGNMPSALPMRVNWLDYEIDTPLTANGLRQSWNVGNNLASHNVPVVACYSSPAIRSIQTADQILGGMGRKGKTEFLFNL